MTDGTVAVEGLRNSGSQDEEAPLELPWTLWMISASEEELRALVPKLERLRDAQRCASRRADVESSLQTALQALKDYTIR